MAEALDSAEATSKPPIESLDRGLRLIEALAEAGPDGVALGALAAGLGINKSTAHRALAALRARDFALQDPVGGNYRLGPRLVYLADRMLDDDNLREILGPALARLCDEVDELVHLGLPNLPWVTYVAKVEPERAVRVWSRVGSRASASSTALGRAILACLPAVPYAELRATLPPGGKAHLAEVVAQAQLNGYASEHGENEPGIACVAVAVLRRGQPRAAVSVSAPIERLSPERGAEIAAIARRVLSQHLPPGLELAAVGSPVASD
ncbi:MAG: IclR family transcriptional regulator [Bifidobacteriaceae bacterium]|jgi:DNA-binding IclR family transcriptional regulator|nr:IclR family transcriptional regulator [Bifidobacteriaceae bacterium]